MVGTELGPKQSGCRMVLKIYYQSRECDFIGHLNVHRIDIGGARRQ